MKEKLIVFVRAPELGKVKTRLAKAIGDRRALAAYKEMLGRLFGNLRYIACLQDPLAERRSPNRRGSRGNQCAGSETGAPSRRSLTPAPTSSTQYKPPTTRAAVPSLPPLTPSPFPTSNCVLRPMMPAPA